MSAPTYFDLDVAAGIGKVVTVEQPLFTTGFIARANSTTIPGLIADQTNIGATSAGSASMRLQNTEFINYKYNSSVFFAGAVMSWPAGVVFNGMANAALTGGFVTDSSLNSYMFGTSLSLVGGGSTGVAIDATNAGFTRNIKLNTAGNGLYVKEGANATMGTATLAAGTVVVNTTKVTANSRIFLTINGGTLTNVGAIYVSARTAGTSFTVSSLNILDASSFAWMIVEPS